MDERTVLDTARSIVARRARRAGLNDADREDVLQDVLVKYLTAFPDDAPRNLAAWVERTTGRLLIDRYRAAGRHRQASWPDYGDPLAVSTVVAAWREATATSLGAMRKLLVREVLGLLSESDREIFARKFLYREPSTSIADALGITANTVDQRARRARNRLLGALEQRPDLIPALAAPHQGPY